MLDLDDFKPVTLEDQEIFREQYRRYPQVHSDNTFTNIVCWNHYAHYQYATLRGSLVILSTIDGKTAFRDPIGPRDPELFDRVLELAGEVEQKRPFYILNPATAAWLGEFRPDLTLHPDRDDAEYVYLRSDLADLPGKEYLSIRRQLNRFNKHCTSTVEAITPANLEEVRTFLNRWCLWKHCDAEAILASERDAVFYAIAHFLQLELSGLVIKVDGEIGAMAIYEQMTPDTALVHYEKGLPDCEGIYKAINTETARHLPDTCTYINRESDMGLPGLREAKTRYHPHHMIKAWYISPEEF